MSFNRIGVVWLILWLGCSDVYGQLLEGNTQAEFGFYHVGAYSKESPIIGIHQRVDYNFSNSGNAFLKRRLSLGGRLGVQLFPNALAMPLTISPKIIFSYDRMANKVWYTRHDLGVNIPLSSFFLRSNLYSPVLGLELGVNKFRAVFVEAGGFYLWDRFGGKELTFTVNVGLKYNF